jgi:hypothetical protein
LNEKMALGSFRPFQFRLAKWGWAGAALAFDVFPDGFEVEQPMPRMDFGRLQKNSTLKETSTKVAGSRMEAGGFIDSSLYTG